ncbi:hypothetical protein Hdeb2414_s0011g00372471 [Helianthus debilis subsp. tardiflorus]
MMNTASTSSGPPAIPLNQQNNTIVQIVSPPVPPPLPEPPKLNLPRSDLLDAEKMNTASTTFGPPAIPLNQQNDTIVQIPVPPPLPP